MDKLGISFVDVFSVAMMWLISRFESIPASPVQAPAVPLPE